MFKAAASFTFCLRPLYTWDITKYVVFCQNILNSFTFFNSVNESLLLILPDSEVLNELCEFQKGFQRYWEDFKDIIKYTECRKHGPCYMKFAFPTQRFSYQMYLRAIIKKTSSCGDRWFRYWTVRLDLTNTEANDFLGL